MYIAFFTWDYKSFGLYSISCVVTNSAGLSVSSKPVDVKISEIQCKDSAECQPDAMPCGDCGSSGQVLATTHQWHSIDKKTENGTSTTHYCSRCKNTHSRVGWQKCLWKCDHCKTEQWGGWTHLNDGYGRPGTDGCSGNKACERCEGQGFIGKLCKHGYFMPHYYCSYSNLCIMGGQVHTQSMSN